MTKGKEEKQAEVVQFAAYKQFCEGTSAEKQSSIAKAEETIETLKADIEKYMATAARLGKEIAAHDEDISVWTGDIKATTKVREMEKNDYDAMHKDYSESVSAITRAIAVLKKQAAGKKQASLVQVSEKDKWGQHQWGHCKFHVLFDRGTFWVLPLICFYLPKSARAYLFHHSVKLTYCCSGPISVDPICPRP